MQPGSTRTADAIVAQLAAGGVARIYGVIGDAVFPLADALAKQRAVRFVAAVNETAAAYMASYEAKLTGRPTACMATSGPGATQLAAGLADAYFDGAPVIALTGQVATTRFGTGEKQFFDQQSFFRPITASTELALDAEGALHAVLAALNRAVLHSSVTHVSIPKDVFQQAAQWSPVPLKCPASPADALLLGDRHEALERLHAAQRPLVMIGLTEANAVQAALALAEKLGAAVIAAQQAKGAVPFACARLIGGIGEAHVPPLVTQADLLVLVGDAPYELEFIPPHVPAVVVTNAHRPIRRHPLIAEFVGSPQGVLKSLHQALSAQRADGAWQQAIRAVRTSFDQQLRELGETDPEPASNPYGLANALSERLAEEAVIAVDTGAFSHWFDLAFRVKRQAVLLSPRWRAIGYALPAAIAAKLACPDRPCVAVVGDGAFLPAMSELVTAIRYELPILVVVVNNARYDIERQKMSHEGFDVLGTSLYTPDFAAFAQACGAIGIRAAAADAIDEALERAIAATAGNCGPPVVLDVRTSVPALPHLVPAY